MGIITCFRTALQSSLLIAAFIISFIHHSSLIGQVIDFSATDGFVLPVADTASISDPFTGQLILFPVSNPVDSTCPPHCGYTLFAYTGETWFDMSVVNGLTLDQWNLNENGDGQLNLIHQSSGVPGLALSLEEGDTISVVLGGPDNRIELEESGLHSKSRIFGPAGATISGGSGNIIVGKYGTISGGFKNQSSTYGAVSGGAYNSSGSYGAVGGGLDNIQFGNFNVIAGGAGNDAFGNYGTITGGRNNKVEFSGRLGSIGGGESNKIEGEYATIPGGYKNRVSGNYGMAAGFMANAEHEGSYIWNDSANQDSARTSGDHQFIIFAQNGVGINTDAPSTPLHVNGGDIYIERQGFGLIFPDGTRQTTAVDQTSVWFVDGNNLTNHNIDFIGTKDDEPFIVRVDSQRVARFNPAPGANDAPSVIMGYEDNTDNGIKGATISGGGSADGRNEVIGVYGTIGGGTENISGQYATIGGGSRNTAFANAATVSGGQSNAVTSSFSAIGGGFNNEVSGEYAVVPGGEQNEVSGDWSFAGGFNAKARHLGSFVWNDHFSATDSLVTTAPNQFLVRASGGFGINTDSTTSSLTVGGNIEIQGHGNALVFGDGTVQSTAANPDSSWSLKGNQVGPSDFFGAINSTPLVFKIEGQEVMQIIPGPSVLDPANMIAGHSSNTILANAFGATISGGQLNQADTLGTVSGGENNSATSIGASVGGGIQNASTGFNATIPGGATNTASGENSFAAGTTAQAIHEGSFVWADFSLPGLAFASTEANQLNFRASGGTRIFSDTLATTGVVLEPGSGAWTSASSRSLKTDFENVDGTQILEKLLQLEILSWRYKSEKESVKHVGPTSENFMEVFHLGENPSGISTVDADGIALIAIQELYKQLQLQHAEIEKLQSTIAQLKE